MEQQPTRFVAYYCLSMPRGISLQAMTSSLDKEPWITQFLMARPNRSLVGTFVDHHRGKHTKNCDFSQLRRALQCCLDENAVLLVAHFKKLIAEPDITSLIEHFLNHCTHSDGRPTDLRCHDMPVITRENFTTLVNYEHQKRLEHRDKILSGLRHPAAKRSGNPNAAKVISTINWPKINASILFALHLAPILEPLERKGMSQRKMVATLNTLGITAPEGGTWVLSQFQKVLERIRVNQMAKTLGAQLKTLRDQRLSRQEMADAFNQKGIKPLKGKTWDARQITQISERVVQLADLQALDAFIHAALPSMEEQLQKNLSPQQWVALLEEQNIPLPDRLYELIT